ncbi:MAG: hypothetical protein HFH91_18755 [Lachnospiraceae bacterium]|nr:hypothetical protein [Lachnospiraceae bacterium]
MAAEPGKESPEPPEGRRRRKSCRIRAGIERQGRSSSWSEGRTEGMQLLR